MSQRGKKYKKAIEMVDKNLKYSLEEAVELLEKTNTVKFDPTVEVHFNLNLDPKYSDQIIRTTLTLPHGTGKQVKICAIGDNISQKDLLSAGASVAWWEELIEDIVSGKVPLDFDVCIATPGMMKHMWKAARVLGPKGLMPNPKAGTVGDDLLSIIREIAWGKFEFKTDKHGNVHSIFGKLSFGKEKLTQNLQKFITTIKEVKPTGAKGKYINTIYVCNAMGPSIQLDIQG